MAEIQTSGQPKGRSRKSTRVDMTAMVDVAFLLLAFFILTTTLVSSKAIHFVVPEASGATIKISQERILTLILGAEDQVYCYRGIPDGRYQRTDFSENGLRQIIQDHLDLHPNPCAHTIAANCWDPIFVIKPHTGSRYKNLVDTIDELRLSKAKKFTMGRFDEADDYYFPQRLLARE